MKSITSVLYLLAFLLSILCLNCCRTCPPPAFCQPSFVMDFSNSTACCCCFYVFSFDCMYGELCRLTWEGGEPEGQGFRRSNTWGRFPACLFLFEKKSVHETCIITLSAAGSAGLEKHLDLLLRGRSCTTTAVCLRSNAPWENPTGRRRCVIKMSNSIVVIPSQDVPSNQHSKGCLVTSTYTCIQSTAQ